jgi:hypothetical protein
MNYVEDFSPLSGLTKLAYLNIARTSITDVTPLLGMTQLKMLWLMNNKISDSDLAKLTEALPECTISSRALIPPQTAGGTRIFTANSRRSLACPRWTSSRFFLRSNRFCAAGRLLF